jgi:hypothetical protein
MRHQHCASLDTKTTWLERMKGFFLKRNRVKFLRNGMNSLSAGRYLRRERNKG